MTKVRLLTVPQKNELVGQLFDTDSYFNPVQDINNDWIISNEETEQCVNPDFAWVAALPEIEYLPKTNPPFPPK
jgi:hypothetical protein